MKGANISEGHMIGDHLVLLMYEAIGGIIEKMTIILIGGELYLQVDLLKQLLDDPRTRVIMDMMGLDIPRACLHAGLHTPKIATAFAFLGCQ